MTSFWNDGNNAIAIKKTFVRHSYQPNRGKGEDGSDDLQEAGENSKENKTVVQAQIIYGLYFNALTMDFWHLNIQL